MSQSRKPQVVLVGRPNVGKSTLFNRLSGARHSIVTAIAGTTRDVITHPVTWGRSHFDLTDTGGLFGHSEDPLHELVVARGHRALKQADLIVFVVDGREGLIPGDQDIAEAVRSAGVPAILAINKTDDRRARAGALELYRHGLRSGASRSVPSMARTSASCWMRSWRSCRRQGPTSRCPRTLTNLTKPVEPVEPEARGGDRDRRPPQRGQVVAGQPAVARRADDRVGGSRHHARLGGFAADVASPPVPDRRHRGHSPSRQGVEVGPGRKRQRAARQTRHRARRRRRAGDRCHRRADRSGRRDRGRGAGGGTRHHHRREQVGPDERAGAGRREEVRREPALPAEVPGLRADPPHFGGDRRAHAEAARGGRQGVNRRPRSASAPASSIGSSRRSRRARRR